MSVTTRIQELNNRLATNLVSKGVSAEGTETTTELINKVNDIESGGTSVINPEWTDWRYFSYYDNRNDLVAKLKYSDTSSGTNFSYMFIGCTKLTTIPQLDTSKGTNFYGMFSGCAKLTTIPQLDTSNGTNFSQMFIGCTNLTTIPQLDTSKGTNFSHMFSSCTNLTNLTMTGTIKANGMDLHYSTKLSKASIISVINALSDTTNALKVQLSKTAVNNAFETSGGVADGSTSEEWTTLIATKANWTIALS